MVGNGSDVNNYFVDKQALAPIREQQTEQRIQENMTPNYVEEYMQVEFQEVAPAINNSLQEKVPEIIVLSDDEEEEKPPQAAHSQVTGAQPFEASPTIEQATTNLFQFQTFQEERIWCYFDPEGFVQGPLSLNTLKLWRDAGFYPPHLRVWKVGRLDNSAIDLTDLLRQWFP